ncbi:MAG: hypothetical protein QNJ51_02920 [Calothrix sp. MO_167.B12]|nr:hypothetical protein [Calothrix sp. MO_167.B12]
MSGRHKFSQLTKDFSAEQKTRIAEKVSELKQEMALHELRQALKLSQL